jgi:hypothetical protein
MCDERATCFIETNALPFAGYVQRGGGGIPAEPEREHTMLSSR